MSFPLNIYLVAFVAAFVVAIGALPVFNRICRMEGLLDDPGHRKIHDVPVPLSGGLTLFTAFMLPVFCAIVIVWFQSGGRGFKEDLSRPATEPARATAPAVLPGQEAFLLRHGLDVRSVRLAGILLGALGMLAIGLLDDRHELKPLAKFVGQGAIAWLTAATGARVTLFVHNPVFQYFITIFWFLAVINAFNFMDNMNGLCSGLGAIGAAYFGGIAAWDGQYLVAVIAFLTFGGLTGFLPYNFPKARAFLGDSGSHLAGYLLAVLAILPHFYTAAHPRRFAVVIPLLVLAVPLGDMAYVVMLRWRMRKPFYVGDTNHLSHRLVRAGFSKTQAVLLIWGLALACGALSLLLN